MGELKKTFDANGGILRLAPNWVPRSFCIPGRRIKLHPDDYYALGGERGGIDERWFASTTPADNGPLTGEQEGLSQIVCNDGSQVTLRDAVEELQGSLIGQDLWERFHAWPIYSKFFDNLGPLPHHVHHRDEHAALVGQRGKPECYYFPPQVNNHGGRFPYTFLGLEPGTSKDQVRKCLENFKAGDNKLTNLSRAYRLEAGTGWDVPPGLLHAPGSLCTYEPQAASDVFAMYQSLVDEQIIPEELLWKNCPADKLGSIDYLLEVLDWDLNVDPQMGANRHMRPILVDELAAMHEGGYEDRWICYKSPAVSAKSLTVLPGRRAVIKDKGAYGFIMMQGHGSIDGLRIETPTMLRFGQLSYDEYFVSAQAAQAGVTIINESPVDPIVMLKHFGPGVCELVQE